MKTNNIFRVMIAVVLVLCVALSMAACAKQPEAQPTPSAAKTEESKASATPAQSSEAPKPVLVMGTNAAFPPYEYYEGNEIVGIDAEIAALIAEKLGMTLKIEDMEFDSILAAVPSGKVDIGMAAITADDERRKSMDFSITYAIGKQVIIVKEDSTITGPEDLRGKKIGVQLTTTGDIYCTDDYGEEAMDRYSKGADAVQALLQGKVDAVVIDNEPAKVFVAQNKGLKILETEYIEEEYAIAIKKGNTELLNKINQALTELKESGQLKAIIDKYIPPQG